MPEPTLQRTLYLVANSHLDTQWRWTIQETIRDYLPRTLRECFAAFESHPSFQLNFEGAFRYMLVREYYPDQFERLRDWVAKGRWHPAGAMLDMPDVNVVAPESLIRHVLYAQRFFRRELGRVSRDLMLPDCFGFNQALPSVAAHCGLLGFSGQKFIGWGAPATYPFDIGVWEGPDGGSVIAAIHPEGYGAGLEAGLEQAPRWIERIDEMKRRSGLAIGYKYFGVRGDRGGAPDPDSLANLEASAASDGPIRIVPASSDLLYRSLSVEDRRRLPRHAGDLLLPTHGTGCLTSQAAMKRWNRDNERLADAAERAAVAADWLGGAGYPESRLRDAWIRFLWHQMHDDITGTSIPRAYGFSWNDQLVALNQFSDVLTDSVGAVARALDTAVAGIPLVVFNPLSFERQDLVEAEIPIGGGDPPAAVSVSDGEGQELPCQLGRLSGDRVGVIFLAQVPAIGFAVYEVRLLAQPPSGPGDAPTGGDDALEVTADLLENRFLRAEIDTDGNLSRLLDKRTGREMLGAPCSLQLLPDRSSRWPAWEILYSDLVASPLTVAGPPVRRTVVESGPARVALELERRVSGSRIVQRLSLAAGEAGRRLEVHHEIRWRSRGRLLKASFPLAVANSEATFDLGLGSIRRGNRSPASYEVPAQEWVDLTAEDGSYGVSILSDTKYGWDKPDDATLRLSLLHSPRTLRRFRHQATQDFGRHRFAFALYGHSADWSRADTVRQATRFNRPLLPFRTTPHEGPLGRRWSFLGCDSATVTVRALKRREDREELILRLQETSGEPVAGATIASAATLDLVAELDGAEQQVEAIAGSLSQTIDLAPYQVRTLALRVTAEPRHLQSPRCLPVPLPYDRAVASRQGEPAADGFDRQGRALPAELLSRRLVSASIPFELGPIASGAANAVTCRGQEIELPAVEASEAYLLAAAAHGDRSAEFTLDDHRLRLHIQHYTGFIGQWRQRHRPWIGWTRPGFLKRDPIAWLGTHRHDRRGDDEPYVFCYLFRYRLRLPRDCRRLRLPDEPEIRILALTLGHGSNSGTLPAGELYS